MSSWSRDKENGGIGSEEYDVLNSQKYCKNLSFLSKQNTVYATLYAKMQSEGSKERFTRRKKGRTWVEAAKTVGKRAWKRR